MLRTSIVLLSLVIAILCLSAGAPSAAAQAPRTAAPGTGAPTAGGATAGDPPGSDATAAGILATAATSLGWQEAPAATTAGLQVSHYSAGAPCASPARDGDAAAVSAALGVGGAPEAPLDAATSVQVNLNGVIADLLLARPAGDPPAEGWGEAYASAYLAWRMGGRLLAVAAETNCPLEVRVEEVIVPLAQALYAAAQAHGWEPDPDRLLSPPTAVLTLAPSPTPQPDVLVEWEPRCLAALGDTGEMLITPLDPYGHPLANEPVTIARLEPPGLVVAGVTGETGSLRCTIAHDIADAQVYRYAVSARGVERIVEIPVVGVRFVLEGNPISGGQFRGVAADGVSTLAVQVEVTGWHGQVRLAPPEYGSIAGTAGAPLGAGALALDPHGRAEFVYRPPDYIATVSDTLDVVGAPVGAGARGVVDELRVILSEVPGHEQSVALRLPIVRPPVMLVHGLDADAAALEPLAGYLRDVGYDVAGGDYGREPGEGAGAIAPLAEVLRQRIGAEVAEYARAGVKLGRVDVIGQSTGGLVARRYVQDDARYRGDVRKLIMIATPNHGIALDDRPLPSVQAWWWGRIGAACEDLHPTSDLLRRLNTGEVEGEHLVAGIEYAVLAGRMPAEEFIDPHLPGDPAYAYTPSDGVVTVSSARLNGAPLFLIDGACHCGALNQLTPLPRPEPGIAGFRATWDRVAALLAGPIAQPPLEAERIEILAGEGCTLVTEDGAMAADGPWPASVPPGATLRTEGRALVALTSGGETWALVSLAPGSEILFDPPSPDIARALLMRGAARFQRVQEGWEARRFSVLVGEAPGARVPFRPRARVWDLTGEFAVEAGDVPRVHALAGRVVAETQNVEGVGVGRLLAAGSVAVVPGGDEPVVLAEPGERWWADAFFRPPVPESVRQLRRVGHVGLGLLAIGLVTLAVGLANHGRYESALEDLRREGESLRMGLSDGAVRRLDLQTLATQDASGRWWSYEPLTGTWSAAVGDDWLPASPPRYSSRRLWVVVGSLLGVVGAALGAATLLLT